MAPLSQPGEPTSGEGVRTLTASDIAELVGGELSGNEGVEVRALAPLDRATESDLSFLANARYAPLYQRTRASAVLIAPEFAKLTTTAGARIVVAKPHDAMLTVLPKLYRAPAREPGVHVTARIGRGVSLGSDVTIGPYAVIGDGAVIGDRTWVESHGVIGAGVVVGPDVRLFPTVTLYSGATLGARVMVQAGARLGSDGFGYVFRNGIHDKIPHIGRCIIEDDVEIGANSTIDRGSFDDTVDWRRHQDRQPRSDWPQRSHRPPVPNHGAGGHRWFRAHRQWRRNRRAGRAWGAYHRGGRRETGGAGRRFR